MKKETIVILLNAIIITMLMAIIMRQPEEPETVNATRETCAEPGAGCYGH